MFIKRLFSISKVIRSPLVILEEVRAALNDKVQPVISLESTIITHGLPFPNNLSMAQTVEETIRAQGGIPATCAFINGVPHVGLMSHQLQFLAEKAQEKKVNKVSRRDIGYTMANSINGGTTIASTMILSHMAGIKVFATGGLGGVHKHGNLTFDVSADLTELGKTPITVVCAGPKSILDIPLTMEYLETQGVFVSTFNDNKRPNVEIPGFYCRESGVVSPCSFDSYSSIASTIHHQNNIMGLSTGNVICVPPPQETALDSGFINRIIAEAIREGEKLGIKGKDLTPFLLGKIALLTNGKSVECNINFVLNNAKAATAIAGELLNLENVRMD